MNDFDRSAHADVDLWLAEQHEALLADLDSFLDVRAGLGEILATARHRALVDDIDRVLDIEAGLAAIIGQDAGRQTIREGVPADAPAAWIAERRPRSSRARIVRPRTSAPFRTANRCSAQPAEPAKGRHDGRLVRIFILLAPAIILAIAATLWGHSEDPRGTSRAATGSNVVATRTAVTASKTAAPAHPHSAAAMPGRAASQPVAAPSTVAVMAPGSGPFPVSTLTPTMTPACPQLSPPAVELVANGNFGTAAELDYTVLTDRDDEPTKGPSAARQWFTQSQAPSVTTTQRIPSACRPDGFALRICTGGELAGIVQDFPAVPLVQAAALIYVESGSVVFASAGPDGRQNSSRSTGQNRWEVLSLPGPGSEPYGGPTDELSVLSADPTADACFSVDSVNAWQSP